MSKTIEGEDLQFAVSSGGNINSEPDTSLFNGPPSDTFNLRITSISADTDPYLFELGETYSLSWSTSSGTFALAQATVLRSDPGPAAGGGLIVFEGVDQNGTLFHVLWAPDFDLQTWYNANTAQGNQSGFKTTDQNSAYSHRYICFSTGTAIMTECGLQNVASLRVGSRVLTMDHGFQPLIWVGFKTVAGTGPNAPVLCNPGTMGNRQPLKVSPQHRLLWRASLADLIYATPEVLMPAKALINGDSIRYAPCPTVTYVHVMLQRHEILNAADGAACESLLAGDMAKQVITPPLPRAVSRQTPARPILTYREARHLVQTDAAQMAPLWWPMAGMTAESDGNRRCLEHSAQRKAALHLGHTGQA
ncbi:MAG: Hint domain-containing protein [Rhodobacterales bacterium]